MNFTLRNYYMDLIKRRENVLTKLYTEETVRWICLLLMDLTLIDGR